MTFLSTGLLAGLIAIGIPVGLHLLARQQPKRVVFPATRFLKQSLDSHRDRLKVRRWWLLAMRILAIAMLAVAFARPQIDTITSEAWFVIGAIALVGLALLALATLAVIRNLAKPLRFTLAIAGLLALLGSGVFGAVTMARAPKSTVTDSSPTALAIVIDNSIRSSRRLPASASASSAASGPSDDSPDVISKMRAAATWMVGEHTSDSLIAIIDRSARPATFSIDRAAATSRIDRTEPLSQVLPLPDRIQAAVALVRSSELQKKSVLVITDLTAPSFSPEHWQSAGLHSLLSQSPPVILQILDVGSDAEMNHSLAQLTVNDPTPPRLAKSNISVVVSSPKRKSGQPPKTLQVQLDLYDTTSESSLGLPIVRDSKTVLPPLRSVDRTSVQADGTSALAVLSVPPLEAGTHHGIVKLITEDELAADNERFVTWVVREPKRILIVGSDRDEMNVLAGALNSPLSVDDPLAEYAIEMSEFLPSDVESWKRFAALILVDPQSPAPPVQSELTHYLQSGGHVLSLLGPSLSAASDGTDSLPAGVVRPWRIPEPGTFIEVMRPQHRAVASLREIAGGVPWHAFRVFQYWQVEPTAGDIVIATYAGTEHPALIERPPAGATGGTQLIMTTPMPALASTTRRWNQLFSGAEAWPAFLLIRDMVDSLIHGDQGSHSLYVGQSTRIQVDDTQPERVADSARAARVQLFPPAGPPVPLAAIGGSVTLTQLDSPGTYWLKVLGKATGVSVNVPSEETDLSRIDEAILEPWLGEDQYSLVRTYDDIRQAEGKGQPTRSLYPAILLLMLAAFVLEQLLSNRFYAPALGMQKPVATA